MDISIHDATNVRVAKSLPWNSNSITLEIASKSIFSSMEAVELITLFGLPEEVTDKLIAVIGDENTKVISKQKGAAK